MMKPGEWYADYSNVVALGCWLNDECADFDSTDQCIYYLSKPWKWSREWELYELWLATVTVEGKEEVREAVYGDTTAEDIQAEWEEREQQK